MIKCFYMVIYPYYLCSCVVLVDCCVIAVAISSSVARSELGLLLSSIAVTVGCLPMVVLSDYKYTEAINIMKK